MLVREVMTAPAVTVTPRTTVRDAVRLLDRHAVTAVPVVDEHGELVGVLSEADLVRGVLPQDARARMQPDEPAESPPARVVADVMSGHPVTVRPDDDLADAVELLTSTAVKSLPVVGAGRVVGVVSRRDVLHLLARDDVRVESEVAELFRADGVDWLVEVTDGVVRVTGPTDDHQRRLATVLARSVAGVVAVAFE
jgi:CBS domain-containing protein